jgi:hypothetical protein
MAKTTEKKKVKGPQFYRLYDREGRTVDLIHPVDVREHLHTGNWSFDPPKGVEVQEPPKPVAEEIEEENQEEEETPILPQVEESNDVKSKRVRR